MRPNLPRSKVAVGRYCVNCCAITSLPSSLCSRQLATCPSQSFPQSRQFKRAFRSSALRLYTDNSPVKLQPKLKAKSPVVCDQQLSQWEANAGQVASKPLKEWEADTESLTSLCQKQVNFWNSQKPLSKEEIESIKKIAKLAILHRSKGNMTFVNILHKDKCFDPELLYLTAQTMFRTPPDTRGMRENVAPEIYEMNLMIRRRLFYASLLGGHIPSALSLWWSFSYDTAAGRVEKEMIMRCLDDTNAASLGLKFIALVKAVKADALDDVKKARKHFDELENMNLGEFDLIWKKKMEYLFAVDEDRAFSSIIHGRKWFAAPMIVQLLEELREFTKDGQLKLRIAIYLLAYSSKYTYKDIAQDYERRGDKLMAREYYELAGATGDKESQRWMVGYLEMLAKGSWLRKEFHEKQLELWKKMVSGEGSKAEN